MRHVISLVHYPNLERVHLDFPVVLDLVVVRRPHTWRHIKLQDGRQTHTRTHPHNAHAHTHALTHIRTHAHTHARTHTTHTHTHSHTHTHKYTHARTHTRAHKYTHARTHTHTHVHFTTSLQLGFLYNHTRVFTIQPHAEAWTASSSTQSKTPYSAGAKLH